MNFVVACDVSLVSTDQSRASRVSIVLSNEVIFNIGSYSVGIPLWGMI